MNATKTGSTEEEEQETSDENLVLLSHHHSAAAAAAAAAENTIPDINAANAHENADTTTIADTSTANTDTNEQIQPRFKDCHAVGFAFGAKYATAHYALQYTPTAAIYELFHCWNIVFVALWANVVLGEKLKTWGEKLACLGIIVGSFALIYSTHTSGSGSGSDKAKTTSEKGEHEHNDNTMTVAGANLSLNLLSLLLNLLNGLLAGGVVVLLRLTMLKSSSCSSSQQVTSTTTNNTENDDDDATLPSSSEHNTTDSNYVATSTADADASTNNNNGTQALRATKVTAYKMLIGGMVLIPFCFAVDGGFNTILSMTRKQLKWLFLSSVTILIYHVNLTWLCWWIQATTVGMLEAFRPVPAFLILSFLLQPQQQQQQQPQQQQSIAWFWSGATMILVSTIIFECSKRQHH